MIVGITLFSFWHLCGGKDAPRKRSFRSSEAWKAVCQKENKVIPTIILWIEDLRNGKPQDSGAREN
jgi:hypothetical protein